MVPDDYKVRPITMTSGTVDGGDKAAQTKRRKTMALTVGVLAALILILLFATRNRILRSSVEVDFTSWSWAHGFYGAEGPGGSITYEYWEAGPLLISVPQEDSFQRID